MSARPDPSRLAAFIDGELSLDEQLAVEAQLREDGALRAEVEAMRALREGLKRQADYHSAPAALRQFADGLVQAGTPPRATPRRFRWPSLPPRVAAPWLAAAAMLSVSLVFIVPRPPEDALLLQEAVAGHVRASLSQHPVDVVSSERHTVKPWLSAQLDYSPPVPALQRPGLVFDGARLDYLDGRRVAVLVYHQGQHAVDAYVWPSASVQNDKPQWAVVKGFRVVRWTQQGMRYCVVSDVNAEEMAALVGAMRQAVEAPPA
jgi:anti-sigma factor RsiW